jgi:hypothetical protein
VTIARASATRPPGARDARAAIRDALVNDTQLSEREREARSHARGDREAAFADRQAAAYDRRAAADARAAVIRGGD